MTSRALLTIAEVSDLTGFSTVTLYKWARTGAIPSKKFGRSVRFDRREVESWIARTKPARKSA